MYNEFTTKVSDKLTEVIQKLIVKFDIGIYILPDDTRVELSMVDTRTVYNKDEYQLASLA